MNGKNWKLDGNQSRELQRALERAFTSKADLKQLVRYHLEETLQTIAKGENVGELIFSLIEWAESTGRVEKLIIAAAHARSSNLNIQDFVENNIDNLIEFESDVLSAQFVVELIRIIKQVSDFAVFFEIGKTILPSIITVARPQEIQVFEQPELSNWFKCFRLLKLLLEDYPLLEQRSSILTLGEHLLKEESIDSSIKQQLEKWLHKIDPNFNSQPSESEQVSSPSSQPTSGALQAYLMITVNPEASRGKVRALASLLCISPTGTRKEIPVHLNPESNERGVLCTWKKLPQIVAQFIDRSVSVELSGSGNLLGCAYYALTIELFLPINYICEPVDRWGIKNEFGNSVYLGSQHRLVVRSYDRVIKPGLKNTFSESWHRAKDLLGKNPELARLQKIEHIKEIDCSGWGTLREALKEKIGIKITCPLPASQSEMVKFLQAMLESGAPLAFWTRCRELPSSEVVAGIDGFLTTELLLNRCELLEEVKKERASAFDYCGKPERRWARHLTVLWDDWERMPTLESF
jgi:hypothetical protein